MNTFKHTPGPWLRIGTTVYALMHDGWKRGVEQFKNRFTVQVQRDRECSEEEAEANARLIAAAPDLLEALESLLSRDERNTCQHEETHRGGTIWEICDSCGAKWSDDRSPKPEWKDPEEWANARAAIAKATQEPQE
jgi:hypothetical protein